MCLDGKPQSIPYLGEQGFILTIESIIPYFSAVVCCILNTFEPVIFYASEPFNLLVKSALGQFDKSSITS